MAPVNRSSNLPQWPCVLNRAVVPCGRCRWSGPGNPPWAGPGSGGRIGPTAVSSVQNQARAHCVRANAAVPRVPEEVLSRCVHALRIPPRCSTSRETDGAVWCTPGPSEYAEHAGGRVLTSATVRQPVAVWSGRLAPKGAQLMETPKTAEKVAEVSATPIGTNRDLCCCGMVARWPALCPSQSAVRWFSMFRSVTVRTACIECADWKQRMQLARTRGGQHTRALHERRASQPVLSICEAWHTTATSALAAGLTRCHICTRPGLGSGRCCSARFRRSDAGHRLAQGRASTAQGQPHAMQVVGMLEAWLNEILARSNDFAKVTPPSPPPAEHARAPPLHAPSRARAHRRTSARRTRHRAMGRTRSRR